MQYSFSMRAFSWVFARFLKTGGISREARARVLAEYRRILTGAKDIGSKNPLLSSYSLASFFIAMNRADGRSPEENYKILADGLSHSRAVRASLGSAKSYLSPKRMPGRQAWSARSHERRYENDWVVDVLPGTADYDLGYDYLECGVCKLCRDEGCPELAQFLCRLDFLLVQVIGIRLERTTTLAEGGEKCDFRFHRL